MIPLITALIPTLTTLLDKVVPDPKQAAHAKLKLTELAQTGALAQLEADTKLALAQTEINKIDAASPSIFKSGWRPMTGWACALALIYQFLARPLFPWIARLFQLEVPDLPDLDTTTLTTLLFALLGLGSLRSVEKIRHAA